jgi:hypothetical protein
MNSSNRTKPLRSGRKKGTPNKNTLPLEQKAQKLGIEPFEVLLLFAKGDVVGLGYSDLIPDYPTIGNMVITPDQRLRAAIAACQYLYPKKKATEIVEDAIADKGIGCALEGIRCCNAALIMLGCSIMLSNKALQHLFALLLSLLGVPAEQ